MSHYNIAFVDLDGPLWSDRVIRFHPDNTTTHPTKLDLVNRMISNGDSFGASMVTYWRMDEAAVGMLNQIMEIQPFITVVSSSWRHFCSRKTIEHIFEINGLNLQLHQHWMTDLHPPPVPRDVFSVIKDERCYQIHRWLQAHPEVKNYAVLDDPASGGSLMDNDFVQHIGLDPGKIVIVDPTIGMEISHFSKLRDLLT